MSKNSITLGEHEFNKLYHCWPKRKYIITDYFDENFSGTNYDLFILPDPISFVMWNVGPDAGKFARLNEIRQCVLYRKNIMEELLGCHMM